MGILNMGFNGVLAVENSGNSALCPAGSRIFQGAFTDKCDAAMLSKAKCRRLASQTTANDKDIKFLHGCSLWALFCAEYSMQGEGEVVTECHKLRINP